jgi:hypothetical protein
MKKIIVLFSLLWLACPALAQVKIHSHNDYTRSTKLHLAYNTRVAEIEADIYQTAGKLIVAHASNEIDAANTLSSIYLNPIDSLFKQYKGRVSTDKGYTFALMIDFKTPWNETFPVLQQEVEKYGEIFDRKKNKQAVQIVISGNRPPDSTFHHYPSWVFFDGLPGVNYDKKDLERITMISDNFRAYSKWNGVGVMEEADRAKFRKVIEAAHQLKKPIRFWAAPDTEACWETLYRLGADIINTDKVKACKTYFEQYN